jgi:hypothetical protein
LDHPSRRDFVEAYFADVAIFFSSSPATSTLPINRITLKVLKTTMEPRRRVAARPREWALPPEIAALQLVAVIPLMRVQAVILLPPALRRRYPGVELIFVTEMKAAVLSGSAPSLAVGALTPTPEKTSRRKRRKLPVGP